MKSPAWALEEAVVAMVEADADIAAMGAEMFQSGSVPASRKAPYITSDEASEEDWGTFGADGHLSQRTWHVWGNTKEEAMRLYAALSELFDGADVPIAGHLAVHTAIRLVATMHDPGPERYYHAVVAFTARTYRA
jgi:hypothetical protein